MQQELPILYTEKERKKVKKHIEKRFGPILGIMKELVSPDICVDIYVVSPTSKRPYYTYVTVGMGAYKMDITGSDSLIKAERIELIMTLPVDWDINSNDDRFYWPVKFMKSVARFPIITGGYLSYRHTVSNEVPFDVSTDMMAVLLSLPLTFDKKCVMCPIGKNETVYFFQLLPIYKEELDSIKEKGSGDFLAKIGEELLKPLNPIRENHYKLNGVKRKRGKN